MSEHCIRRVGVALCLLLLLFASAQGQGREEVYRWFRDGIDMSYLKGIETRIEDARSRKDGVSLGICASLLYYAQHATGKKHESIDASAVLLEATRIAWQDKDRDELEAIQAVWASRLFGPNNEAAAKAIEEYRASLVPKEDYPATPAADPKLLLMAEEQARMDALQQIAERIFGVMIHSMTEISGFVSERGLVIAELQKSLLAGAKFGEPEVFGEEVRVSAVIPKSSVIASLRQASIAQGRDLSASERAELERSLHAEYRAIGIGVMSE